MTAVATLAKGYDAMYYIAQVGGQPRRGGEYYTSAVAHGEPPGIWLGRAAQRLGFEPGQTVENEPYLKLLNERRAPDGTKLGRKPSGGAKAHEVYEQLLAAEPHADTSRRRELRIAAQQQVRQSPLFRPDDLALEVDLGLPGEPGGERAAGSRTGRCEGRSVLGA